MGIGIAAIGLAITGLTFAIAPGGYFVVAYGAVLAGGIQFVIGLYQLLASKLRGRITRAEDRLSTDIAVVIRSMATVAAADGVLEPEEILMIKDITSDIFGEEPSDEQIRKICGNTNHAAFVEELKHKDVPENVATLAVHGAIMVAMIDGEVHSKERQAIVDIAIALDLDDERLSTLVREAGMAISGLLTDAGANEKRS